MLEPIGLAIAGPIGREHNGLSAAQLETMLGEAEGGSVRLYVSSRGGSIDESLRVMDVLKSYAGFSECYVMLCASAAAFVALGCDRVVMEPQGRIFMHPPQCTDGNGNPWPVSPERAERLAQYARTTSRLFAERSGKPIAYWDHRLASDLWLRPFEAVECGIADVILDTPSDLWNVPAGWAERH